MIKTSIFEKSMRRTKTLSNVDSMKSEYVYNSGREMDIAITKN
jgi:hypothetical protein